MKKASLSFFCVYAFVLSYAQSKQQIIANETAFTKLYGYVRYFYPGDEAAAINWDRFAIYGAKQVATCTNGQALKQTLKSLFDPIVPTLQLADSSETITFNKQSVIPPSLKGYKTIAWQHVGGRARPFNYKGDPFQSARTNRKIVYRDSVFSPPGLGSVPVGLNIAAYQDKEFILRGRAKMVNGSGSAFFEAATVRPDNKPGFFNNMAENPITTTDWKAFEIKGKIDADAQQLQVGACFFGNGEFWVDDMSVTIKDLDNWKTLFETNFNREKTGATTRYVLLNLVMDTTKLKKKVENPGYNFSIIEDSKMPGEKWLSIKSKAVAPQKESIAKHSVFFAAYPKVGEYVTKNIGGGLKIIMPISVYGNETSTYPVADSGKFAALQSKLSSLQIGSADSLATRFGDLVITWNMFQHFFPYFDVANTNWTADLKAALANAIEDENSYGFGKTLQKLTAKLKDEHTAVSWTDAGDRNYYTNAITWEWIENKLVVTNVLDKSLPLAKGDIITAINNQNPGDYFKNVEQYISAATVGGLVKRAEKESLFVPTGSTLKLSFLDHDNVPCQTELVRNVTMTGYQHPNHADSIKKINENIMYVNIGVADIKTINRDLPQLQKSKVIICDLRNNKGDIDNNHLIEYLLTKKDTAKHWLQIAHIIYPDQEKIAGYDFDGFGLVPAKPHLGAKIIFLVDASDYSWAESYIGIIAHYKLATIVGQNTAGTNGTLNQLLLPGGYTVSFSGHKVTQLDGSPHQGVGNKPDIYVAKTANGVRAGKDEILEKAIEIAKAAIQ